MSEEKSPLSPIGEKSERERRAARRDEVREIMERYDRSRDRRVTGVYPQERITQERRFRDSVSPSREGIVSNSDVKQNGSAGHSSTTLVFSLSALMPSFETTCPSKPAEEPKSQVLSVSLGWDNICVTVKPTRPLCGLRKGKPEKQVLKNVSGHAKPGTLLAIIGASGSGKTTLLNTLTGQKNHQKLDTTGSVLIDGVPIGQNIRSISAFVQQDDLFIPELTVREHLIFRAMVRMEKHLTTRQRIARVDDVIAELGLTGCADTRIGDPAQVKGISGGQMRRLSFASEILTNPPLLFCDEPTSGLDSFMAGSIVQMLQAEAAMGRTVLCTIHQPSSEVFALFTNVLIMAEGRVAFMGTVEEALAFYGRLNYRCPSDFNPSDFFVHTNAIRPGKEEECKQRVETICDAFELSQKSASDHDNQPEASELPSDSKTVLFDGTKYDSTWIAQFSALVSRTFKTTVRHPIQLKITIGQAILFALIHGLVFLRRDVNQTGVMDINGAIFLIILNFSTTSLYGSLNTFPAEVPVFLRDYARDLYRVDVYYLSKVVVELPIYIIVPILFATISYWMIGFYETFEKFAVYLLIMFIVSNVAVSFGYIISAASPNASIAVGAAGPIVITLMLFGGFFLNGKSVPPYFIWIEYISWFKYANEWAYVNQWESVTKIACDASDASACDGCLFLDGAAVLNYLGYDKSNVTVDIIVLIVLVVAFKIVAFLVLFVRAKLSQK